MSLNPTSPLGVIGAGTMGNGIAHVIAKPGRAVLLYNVSEAAINKGLATIRTNLDREAAKGVIDPAEAPAIFARIQPVHSLAELSPCALIIEAASERLEIKLAVFRELDTLLAPEAILASN